MGRQITNPEQDDDIEKLRAIVADIGTSTRSITKQVRTGLVDSAFAVSAVADALSDACILVDRNGVIQGLNKQARQILGVYEVIHAPLIEILRTFNPTIDLTAPEWAFYVPETPVKYYEVSVSHVGPNELYILRDVTLKKRVEMKSLDTGLFQQNMIRCLPATVFYTDINGNFVRGSDLFLELMGWKRIEALSKGVRDFIIGDDACSSFNDQAANSEVYEVRILTVNGESLATVRKNKILSDNLSSQAEGFICVIERQS